MAPSMTEEQKKRAEENRQRAMAKRAERAQQQGGPGPGSLVQQQQQRPQLIPAQPRPQFGTVQAQPRPGFMPNQVQPRPTNTYSSNTAYNTTSNVNNNNINKAPTTYKNGNQNQAKSQPKKKTTGGCRMISKDTFMVEMLYHKESIDLFKTIPGNHYDPHKKKWTFPFREHDNLIGKAKDLETLETPATIGALPAFVRKIFRNADEQLTSNLEYFDSQVRNKLDPRIALALLPFQREGVSFGIQQNGRVLIADDMGLGKTIQALAIANYYSEDWPLLIVCPSSMKYSWLDSLEDWLPSVALGSIHVVESSSDYIMNTTKVIIMSYDSLCKKANEPPIKKCKVIIMDESHHLKNYKTARTKAAQPLLKACKRAILLSGTPALSRPMELFTQVQSINSSMFTFEEFGVRYCNGKRVTYGQGKETWDFSGSSNMEELQLVLEQKVMVRRLKSEVLKQLPSKRRQVVWLNKNLIKKKQNKEFKDSEKNFSSDIHNRSKLLQYYHHTGVAKIDAVIQYIDDLLESETKFICFGYHKEVLNAIGTAIEEKFKQMKQPQFNFIRIDGNTPPEDRKKFCDKFQTSDNCRVALLSIKAANMGITLTAASLVVFAELWWNPGELTQAEDRVHRIGQEDCVVVKYLVAKGTADDHIWSMVSDKLDTLNQAGLSKDNFRHANVDPERQQVNPEASQSSSTQKSINDYFSSIPSQTNKSQTEDSKGSKGIKNNLPPQSGSSSSMQSSKGKENFNASDAFGDEDDAFLGEFNDDDEDDAFLADLNTDDIEPTKSSSSTSNGKRVPESNFGIKFDDDDFDDDVMGNTMDEFCNGSFIDKLVSGGGKSPPKKTKFN